METQVNGGISTLSLLGVIFVTLKLCGVISWSWWLVTMPFWLGPVIGIIVVIALLAYYGVQHSRGVDLS